MSDDRPESELQAAEVAFVNTCKKHFDLLCLNDRGRHHLALEVLDERGVRIMRLSTISDDIGVAHELPVSPDAAVFPAMETYTQTVGQKPPTLAEFDSIVRTGTAELPPVEPPTPFDAEAQVRLNELLTRGKEPA